MHSDDEIKDTLREILKWTKFQGMQKVKQVLETALDTDTKKLIYHLSDGRPSPAIAAITGADQTTIRGYWKDWVVIGIVEIHPAYKKRYHRVFSLRSLGIGIPKYQESTES